MSRFQSRLFNWVDTSLPAKFGRSVRRSLDQKIRQLAGLSIQEFPRLLAYQVAKVALYPVYLIAATVKRGLPALDRRKVEPKQKLRSQPEATGLLPKSASQKVERTNDLPKPESPLFFRPLAKFLDWIDRAKTQLDRNISAIVKRQPENLSTTEALDLESKLIANRLFAEIWRQQIDQAQAKQNSLKENNGLSENVALGKNKRLEQLRRLIEAAIVYFFGNQAQPQEQSLESNEEVTEIFGTKSSDAEGLPDSLKLRRRRVTAIKSGRLKENAPLVETNNLDRLRDLIAAAIDYFIGKRSLDGNPDPEPEFSDALKIDSQFERLQQLIEEAIAYFFGKQQSQPSLDETSEITPSVEAWLTMEDLFGDDNGPWPLSLEYESIAFSKSPDRTAIHSSSELQNFETTTTQISQDQVEGSLVFEEELLMYQSQNSNRDRPLRAWIETKANLWGYSNNPMMRLLIWIDAIVLKIENLIVKLWNGLVCLPNNLINFIRYGKFR